MRDLRSPVQRALDEELHELAQRGLNTIIYHAEKSGRGWVHYHVGRFGAIALVAVEVTYQKRR